MTIRVGIVGARGAMGTAACAAVEAADGLEMVARVNRGDSLDVLVDAGAEVVVDLTHPDAVMENLEGCLRRGLHVVVGTSGFDDDRLERVRGWLAAAPELGVIVAPNFSVGAVLMMRFAAQAAPYFESVEIVELHRATKPDAPSGTAYRTAGMVAAARRDAGAPPLTDATTQGAPGARGADVQGVRVHSVRLRGLLAHQEVLLGGEGEVLTIRHDSMDRSSFMPGIVLAARAAPQRPGLTVGLEHLLDEMPST
jgi:4-hydroxy-tetrahydrodipicolinate reductase